MRLKISKILTSPADRTWEFVKDPRNLLFVSRGMLGFCNADRLPPRWQEGDSFRTRLLFFHLLPGWIHEIHIEHLDDRERELCTNETGKLVPVWRHRIHVEAVSETQCRYTDEIEFQAGLLSPLVWLWAQIFYRYRLYRSKQLAKLPARA